MLRLKPTNNKQEPNLPSVWRARAELKRQKVSTWHTCMTHGPWLNENGTPNCPLPPSRQRAWRALYGSEPALSVLIVRASTVTAVSCSGFGFFSAGVWMILLCTGGELEHSCLLSDLSPSSCPLLQRLYIISSEWVAVKVSRLGLY